MSLETPSDFHHAMVDIEPGVRIHYAATGEGDRTVVLLHGFPQTWWAWRRVAPLLAEAGYRVIAVDYRGAGASSKPLGGYDKRTMAKDLRFLIKDHLGLEAPVSLVGHDIGLMVAYAYAEMYRADVSHLAVMDAPIPGTAVYEKIRVDPRVWQFSFHNVRDIPEMLITGRERQYIQAFVGPRVFNPSAITEEDLDVYASAYSAVGGLRAGLELYRAFGQDATENREALQKNGKLSIPVLAVHGTISAIGAGIGEMMREVADDVEDAQISGAGHWIAEENPVEFTNTLTNFLSRP